MKPEERTVRNTIIRYRSFRYALVLEGIAVGAISGAVVVAFRYLIGCTDTLLHRILAYGQANHWFIPVWFAILAVAALIVTLLLKWDPLISGSGIPQIEGEIMGELDSAGGGCWRLSWAEVSCPWAAACPWGGRVPASSWEPWPPRAFQG